MTDHSEFPWGPQYEPGLLTPFGLIGWVVASALLLALLLQLFSPAGRRTSAAHLDDVHKIILAAARFAHHRLPIERLRLPRHTGG